MKQTKFVFSIPPTQSGSTTTSHTGQAVDASGYEEVKVIHGAEGINTATGVSVSNIRVQGSNDNSAWTTISGATAASGALANGEGTTAAGQTIQGYMSGRLGYRYFRTLCETSGTGPFCSGYELGAGAAMPDSAADHGASGYFAIGI